MSNYREQHVIAELNDGFKNFNYIIKTMIIYMTYINSKISLKILKIRLKPVYKKI